MSKPSKRKQEKKLRKERKEKTRRAAQEASLAYTGRKYKTPELVNFMLHAESGINEARAITDGHLTDRDVAEGLERLILAIRRGDVSLATLEYRSQQETLDLVPSRILANWQALAETDPLPSRDKLLGVLRTILGSVELRRSADPESRHYLDFLVGFLAKVGVRTVEVSREEAARLAGEVEVVDFREGEAEGDEEEDEQDEDFEPDDDRLEDEGEPPRYGLPPR